MYICDRCGSQFEEPAYAKEYHGELTSPYGTPYEEYMVCPSCRSEEISLLYECKLCGGKTKNIEYCDECHSWVKDNYLDLIDRLSKYFDNCDDPKYYIEGCIEDIMNE